VSSSGPRFRPRSAQQARARRRLYLAGLGVLAVLILAGAGVLIGFSVAGDDDTPAEPEGESTAGTIGGPEPILAGPASRYAVQSTDLTDGFDTASQDSFPLTATGFASLGHFPSASEGERLAGQWGYIDGYRASFEPDGLLSDVVRGGFYITVDCYLFQSAAGAEEAYGYLQDLHTRKAGSERLDVRGLGNQSSAFAFEEGVIAETELIGLYQRYIFRRGNLVALVQTFGAADFLKIDRARDLAVVVDLKALGQVPSSTPTPGPTSPVVAPGSQPTSQP
jgi:hypothetical protein